ncbi:unnamed protein product [Bursaphelenchus xylophilus]|uniref:(pine wood nematode) hypothetical protein n=1 Tax=Bursaphelenchus xylophilus TaxID=6326 RepID=A0A1I7RT22_BURXY|nr:unnamed protein product [Bursaphelenchus xylophilus]CAG9122666.1 unnamed protein product [Bursaphelenchus xylophilus]
MAISFDQFEIVSSSVDGTTCAANLDNTDLFEVTTAATIKTEEELPRDCEPPKVISFPFAGRVYFVVDTYLYGILIEDTVVNEVQQVLPGAVCDYNVQPEFALLALDNGVIVVLGEDGVSPKTFQLSHREGTSYSIGICDVTIDDSFLVVLVEYPDTAELIIYSIDKFGNRDFIDGLERIASFPGLPLGFLAVTTSGISIIPKNCLKSRLYIDPCDLLSTVPQLQHLLMDDAAQDVDEVHTFDEMMMIRRDGFMSVYSNLGSIRPCGELDFYSLRSEIVQFQILNHEGSFVKSSDKVVLQLRDGDSYKLHCTTMSKDFSYSVEVPKTVGICSKMTIATTYADNVVYAEGFGLKSPQGVRIRFIYESRPDARLSNLLDKQRFDAAMKWALEYGLDTGIVIAREVQYIVSMMIRFGTEEQDMDEFISLLSQLPDDQSFDYAYEVMMLARNRESIQKMLDFCRGRQIKDESLISSVQCFKYAVTSYCLVYGPDADFSDPIWELFWNKEGHWDLFKQLVEDGKIDRARCLWQRYVDNMETNLQTKLEDFPGLLKSFDRVIRSDLALVNDVIQLLEHEILHSFVSLDNLPALSQYSECLVEFLQTVVSLLERSSQEYPFNAYFVADTVRRFRNKILKDVDDFDRQHQKILQLSQISAGLQTPNCFTDLDILRGRLKMICHIKKTYDVNCSMADVTAESFEALALKMLINFTYRVVDHLQVYAQTKVIPFCKEFKLDKDEIFLKFVKCGPRNLPVCLVLADMMDDSDLCARTTMAMMKSCPLTKSGWPPVLQAQIVKVLSRDISSSIRNQLNSLLLRRDIAMILLSYPKILRKNLITDIPTNQDLSSICFEVINAPDSTMVNKFDDVQKLHSMCMSDRALCFDFELFCQQVLGDLTDVAADCGFLDDFIRCLSDYEMKKRVLMPSIVVSLELMGQLPTECMPKYVKRVSAFLGYLNSDDPERLNAEEQMLVIYSTFTSFSLQITPNEIGNFEKAEGRLIDALLNTDNDLTFSGYQHFGEMLLLDMDKVVGLLYKPEVVQKMLVSEELKLRLQSMLSALFNGKLEVTYEHQSLIDAIYLHLSLFGQYPISMSDVAYLAERIASVVEFIELNQVKPGTPEIDSSWSTLLMYAHFVQEIIRALTPREPLDDIDDQWKNAENMEREKICNRAYEGESLCEIKVLHTAFNLAMSANNESSEKNRQELWNDLLMHLISTYNFELCLKAFQLINNPAFISDPTPLYSLYQNFLGLYLEKLIAHYGKEFYGLDAAVAACRSAPDEKQVEAVVDQLFKSFYQKQDRIPAYRCVELQMKLGFLSPIEAVKRMNAILCINELVAVGVNLSSRFMVGGPLCAMETLVISLVPPGILINWCQRFGHDVEQTLRTYVLKLVEVQIGEGKKALRTKTVADTLESLAPLGDQTKLLSELLQCMLAHVNPYDYDLIHTVLTKCVEMCQDQCTKNMFKKYLHLIKFLKSNRRVQLIGSAEVKWLKAKGLDQLQDSVWAKARLPFHIFFDETVTSTLKEFLLYELGTEQLPRWKDMVYKCKGLVPLTTVTLETSAILSDLERCCQLDEMNLAVLGSIKQLLAITLSPTIYLKKIACKMNELPNSIVRTEFLRLIYTASCELFSNMKAGHGAGIQKDEKFKEYEEALLWMKGIRLSGEMHTFLKNFDFISPQTSALIGDAKATCTVIIDEFTDWDNWDQIAKALAFLGKVSSQNLINLRSFLRNYLADRLSGHAEMVSVEEDEVTNGDLNLSMVPMEASAEVSEQYGVPYMDKDVTKLAMIVSMAYDDEEVVQFLDKIIRRPNEEVKWLCVVLRASIILGIDIQDKISPRLETALKEELLKNSRERTNLKLFEENGKELLIRSQICTTNVHTTFKNMDTQGQLRLCSSIALSLIKQDKIEFIHVSQLIDRLLAQKMSDVAFTLLKSYNTIHEPIRNQEVATLYAAIFSGTLEKIRLNTPTGHIIEPRTMPWVDIKEKVGAMIRCPEDCHHLYQNTIAVLRKMGMEKEARQLEIASDQLSSNA